MDMLQFIALLIVVMSDRINGECERPKYLIESEKECLEITTSVFERMANTATGVLNMAKRKLGIDVDEEPLKYSYYLCLLHNIKMVTEAGILDPVGINEWIETHAPSEVAEEFGRHTAECLEMANKVIDIPNCQKSTFFIKCLSEFNSCPMFKFP